MPNRPAPPLVSEAEIVRLVNAVPESITTVPTRSGSHIVLGARFLDTLFRWVLANAASPEAPSEPRTIRVGREEDEIVAHGHIHVERMSDRHIWANLGGVSFDFSVRGKKLVWAVQLADGWSGIERELKLNAEPASPRDGREQDGARLDWLEKWAKHEGDVMLGWSRADSDYDEFKGETFRWPESFYAIADDQEGQPYTSLRAAIDAARAAPHPTGD